MDNGMHTSDIDVMMAHIIYSSCIYDKKYLKLSSRLLMSNHLKNISHFNKLIGKNGIKYCYSALYASRKIPLLSPLFMGFIISQGHIFDKLLDGYVNFTTDYNGYNLLSTNYLLKIMKNNFDINIFKNQMLKLFNIDISTTSLQVINNIVQTRGIILETPEYMLLRTSIALCIPTTEEICNSVDFIKNIGNDYNGDDILQYSIKYFNHNGEKLIDKIMYKFNTMKSKCYTHATPTLFNSGTINQQLASCFLLGMDDSLKSIGKYYTNCMTISKNAGGIGTYITDVRCEGSYINGTGGVSNGIAPLLRVSDSISSYVDQGGNKRSGANAIYIEPWHADIEKFLNLKPTGQVGIKAHALYYALWINDEFNRVMTKEYKLKEEGKDYKLWYLMDPISCPELIKSYDETLNTGWVESPELGKYSFTYYYRKYIEEGKYIKKISAHDLWEWVCKITSETGMPYKCFKDAANRKTNHSNLGVIKCSNLCTEIYQYSSAEEIAVCNLASICLPKFITKHKPKCAHLHPFSDGFKSKCNDTILYFDFEKLINIVDVITINLNNTIDKSNYPVDGARMSNNKNRPIGIGVQGLADTFSKLWLSWGSETALKLDFHIFEYMYYSSLTTSCKLSEQYGSYDSYDGSPTSYGFLQHDLWDIEHINREDSVDYKPIKFPVSCDWEILRKQIQIYGLRNSLCIAPMPTASTSTVMNNSPSVEPYNALIYKRVNIYGETIIYNKQLMKILKTMGLWYKNKEIFNKIMKSKTGGIQDTDLPDFVKENFKTAFELSPRIIIDHALVRSVFVDQGISLNLFIPKPTANILTSCLIYAWKRGIKTGVYYTRRLSPVDAKKIKIEDVEDETDNNIVCTDDVCVMCQG